MSIRSLLAALLRLLLLPFARLLFRAPPRFRWMTLDLEDAGESRFRTEMLGRIDAWWAEFERRLEDVEAILRSKRSWDLPGWMAAHLQAIHPALLWEFGATPGGGHQLVVTLEVNRWLRPLVGTILERAPCLEGWSFHAHRQPEEDLETARDLVRARTGAELPDVRVRAVRSEIGQIDLAFLMPPGMESAIEVAFVAAEVLLGEETLERWIGAIDLEAASGDPAGSIPLGELRRAVDALREEVRRSLPDRPYHEIREGLGWVLMQGGEQVPDSTFSDLVLASTCVPAVLGNAVCGATFDSLRFSRLGEIFAYVQLDGSYGPTERGAFEEAIDRALVPTALGCVVGGGTGTRSTYVVLALTDPARAVPAIRDALRPIGPPERSWLRFLDSDLAAEWAGLHDLAPAPPGAP